MRESIKSLLLGGENGSCPFAGEVRCTVAAHIDPIVESGVGPDGPVVGSRKLEDVLRRAWGWCWAEEGKEWLA